MTPRNLKRLESAFVTGDPEVRHPSFEELESLADGKADAASRELLALHFSQCPACNAEFHDLTAFRKEMLGAKQPRPLVSAGILGTALAAGLLIFFLRGAPPSITHLETPRLVASLHDGNGTLGIDSLGVVHGVGDISAQDRELLREVMQTGTLPVSKEVAGLRRSREVLLGGAGESGLGFRILRPAGTVVPDNRPRFEWTVPAGASGFVVSVYTASFEPVVTSPKLKNSGWSPSRPLPDGQTFVWTVSAIIHGRHVTVPHTPEPEARFRTPNPAERRQLEMAMAATPHSALLKAAVAARLGMIETAREALSDLEPANPGSPLLSSLQATLK